MREPFGALMPGANEELAIEQAKAKRGDMPKKAFSLSRCDHIVLTVADKEKSVAFYTEALGMRLQTFSQGRVALIYGAGKINLHEATGKAILPRAKTPTPGSADLCFIVDAPLEAVISTLKEKGVAIELGPVKRTGAFSQLRSIYVRDPDGNLIELSNEVA